MTDSEKYEWFEWGYRLEDGTEEWEVNFGTDGSWIVPAHGVGVVDIYNGSEASSVYHELDKAGMKGTAIKRLVTELLAEPETVERA